MADIPSTPEDFSSDPVPVTQAGNQSTPTGLLEAEYTCPQCGAVVVRILGNSIQYLYTHLHGVSDEPDAQGYVSQVFCHSVGEGGMIYPPRIYVPPVDTEHPFLAVQSSVMTPFSQN